MGYDAEIQISIHFPRDLELAKKVSDKFDELRSEEYPDVGEITSLPEAFEAILTARNISYNEAIEQWVTPFLELHNQLYIFLQYASFGEHQQSYHGYRRELGEFQDIHEQIKALFNRSLKLALENNADKIHSELQSSSNLCLNHLTQLEEYLAQN